MAFVYHHFFCDESGKFQTDPLIAFCAVSATGDRLKSFDEEWRAILRSYELDSLHMKHASRLDENIGYRLRTGQTLQERSELLFPFADCINRYLEMGVIQAWDVRGFNSLPHELLKALGGSIDPFFMALIRGMTYLTERLDHETDRFSIIFDNDPYTAWDAYNHFRALGKAEPMLQKMGMSFTFADDRYFPALQAADLLAFLTRYEANEKFNGIANIWRNLFDRLVTEPKPPYGIMRWFKMFADEETLFQFGQEAYEAAEQATRERKEKQQRRIPSLQSGDGDNTSRRSESSEKSDGSGKEGERRKAES
jgi:hypothetical protein